MALTGTALAQDKLNLRVSQSDERFKSSGSHAEWRIKNKTHTSEYLVGDMLSCLASLWALVFKDFALILKTGSISRQSELNIEVLTK